MLADISFFESLGKNNGQGANTVFNGPSAILFQRYGDVKYASAKCDEIIDSVQSSGVQEMATLIGAMSDARKKYGDELFSLQQKIGKEMERGLDDQDRRAYLKLPTDIKSDFQDLVSGDPVLVHANKTAEGKPAPTFNNYDDDRRAEFASYKNEFFQSATSELLERANMLKESTGQEYRNIVRSALNTAIESLRTITLERSELPKLEAILKRFSDTIDAAEIATARPKLELPRTKQAGENLKRMLGS